MAGILGTSSINRPTSIVEKFDIVSFKFVLQIYCKDLGVLVKFRESVSASLALYEVLKCWFSQGVNSSFAE